MPFYPLNLRPLELDTISLVMFNENYENQKANEKEREKNTKKRRKLFLVA